MPLTQKNSLAQRSKPATVTPHGNVNPAWAPDGHAVTDAIIRPDPHQRRAADVVEFWEKRSRVEMREAASGMQRTP